jgi:hypothetical protein
MADRERTPDLATMRVLDQRKAELERQNPGWQVWYVRQYIGDTRWCARPLPLLNADTPDHLAEAMADADDEILHRLRGGEPDDASREGGS